MTPHTGSTSSFQIRPEPENNFRAHEVYEVLHACLLDELAEYEYNAADVEQKSLRLTETIRNKVRIYSFCVYRRLGLGGRALGVYENICVFGPGVHTMHCIVDSRLSYRFGIYHSTLG